MSSTLRLNGQLFSKYVVQLSVLLYIILQLCYVNGDKYNGTLWAVTIRVYHLSLSGPGVLLWRSQAQRRH